MEPAFSSPTCSISPISSSHDPKPNTGSDCRILAQRSARNRNDLDTNQTQAALSPETQALAGSA